MGQPPFMYPDYSSVRSKRLVLAPPPHVVTPANQPTKVQYRHRWTYGGWRVRLCIFPIFTFNIFGFFGSLIQIYSGLNGITALLPKCIPFFNCDNSRTRQKFGQPFFEKGHWLYTAAIGHGRKGQKFCEFFKTASVGHKKYIYNYFFSLTV
jgi:hypothetical protein